MNQILYDKICSLYNDGKNIKEIARQLHKSEGTVRKVLMDAKLYTSSQQKNIAEAYSKGLTDKQIAEALNVSLSTVNNYKPYTKFNTIEPSKNALRIRKSRKK